MSSSQLLNYQFHQTKQAINSPTLVFIHGLFGDMNNLGVIARAFSDNYNILRVDWLSLILHLWLIAVLDMMMCFVVCLQ